MGLNAPFVDLYHRPNAGLVPLSSPTPASTVGFIVPASEVSLLVLLYQPTALQLKSNVRKILYVTTQSLSARHQNSAIRGRHHCRNILSADLFISQQGQNLRLDTLAGAFPVSSYSVLHMAIRRRTLHRMTGKDTIQKNSHAASVCKMRRIL